MTRTEVNNALAGILQAQIDIPEHLQANQLMLDYVDQEIAAINAGASIWVSDKPNYYTKGQVDVIAGTKSNTVHTHTIGDVVNLQSNLNLKADLIDGKVPQSQLPSYVDDVLEYANLISFPSSGETSKIYLALDTNFPYRWSGSAYVKIADGAPVSGSPNYLQNQNALGQSANFWINGTGRIDGRFGIGVAPISAHVLQTLETDVDGRGLRMENSSANGTNKFFTLRQLGSIANGVSGWASGVALEGNADGPLILSSRGAGGIIFATNSSRNTRMSIDANGNVTFNIISNATTTTDKILVSDGGVLKYRTGTQLISDLNLNGLYIQNQSAAAQTATGWINGLFRVGNLTTVGQMGLIINPANTAHATQGLIEFGGNVSNGNFIYANLATRGSGQGAIIYVTGSNGNIGNTGRALFDLDITQSNTSFGVVGYRSNIIRSAATNQGTVGYYTAIESGSGTGIGYGLRAIVTKSGGSNPVYGVHVNASNLGSGTAYAIYAEAGLSYFGGLPHATTNTNSFLVSDSGVLKYRTATELNADLGQVVMQTYSPTVTGIANVSSYTLHKSIYRRSGEYAVVSGVMSVTPTATGDVEMSFTLPISSTLASVDDIFGQFSSKEGYNGCFEGNTSTNTANLKWVSPVSTSVKISFCFTYKISV